MINIDDDDHEGVAFTGEGGAESGIADWHGEGGFVVVRVDLRSLNLRLRKIG